MLGKALNRCQATPIVSVRAMTISQTRLTTIFTNAMTLTRSALSGNRFDSAVLTGCDQPGASSMPEAILAARIDRMQRPMTSTTASTK